MWAERKACRGCLKQREWEGCKGNLRPQKETGVGELMRALVCVHGSMVHGLDPVGGRVAEMTVDQRHDCLNERLINWTDWLAKQE